MKKYDNAIFFPAISMATNHTIIKRNWLVNGKSPRFYLNGLTPDKQLFHHPYLLTSAAHNYKDMTHAKTLGINDLSKDIDLFFGDSGGFQIATGEIANTPEMVDRLYSWLESNVTVAPIIDCPPWTTPAADISQADLDEGSRKTKINVDRLFARPKKDAFTWLNVLQGRSYEQRNYWYNKVKDFNLQGWALGSMRKNAYNILVSFASLLDNGELEHHERCQLIHFFGFSAIRYIPYIVYLKHKMMERGYGTNISFDSSYATQNGGWGKYLIYPSSTGFMSYHLSNKYIGKFKDVPLPCDCSVCSGIMLSQILNEHVLDASGQNFFYNVVQNHNLNMVKRYVNMIHSLIYTGNAGLWSTAFNARQIRVFKVIDKMFDAKQGEAIHIIEKNHDVLDKSRLSGPNSNNEDEVDPEAKSWMLGEGDDDSV